MPDEQKWHGVSNVKQQQGAPAKPGWFRAMSVAADPNYVYAHVHFTGNWGTNFCSEYREHDAYNITQATAHSMAWSLYGMCGHNIYYYDSAGNLIGHE